MSKAEVTMVEDGHSRARILESSRAEMLGWSHRKESIRFFLKN